MANKKFLNLLKEEKLSETILSFMIKVTRDLKKKEMQSKMHGK